MPIIVRKHLTERPLKIEVVSHQLAKVITLTKKYGCVNWKLIILAQVMTAVLRAIVLA